MMNSYFLNSLFHLNPLGVLMTVLVGAIGVIVGSFATRYLNGAARRKRFLFFLGCLICSIVVMVFADHLVMLLLAWITSNWLLVKLMVHKEKWKAAQASGRIAKTNFFLGFVFVSVAFLLFYIGAKETSIQKILSASANQKWMLGGLICLTLGAMTQSALWPFHKWLLSSLNSPTPASAIMHAGLINGGGFLFARFGKLFYSFPKLLTAIFVIGLISALLGTFWKLMQSDVKRMLACSTMGQMGFMVVQCGLGLFSAAVAHLCWHGMFKAYLFLSSSSAVQEKRIGMNKNFEWKFLLSSLFCGVLGSSIFLLIGRARFFSFDALLIPYIVVLVASTQAALTVFHHQSSPKKYLAVLYGVLLGAIYGLNVQLIETFLEPLHIFNPQRINVIYLLGAVLLFFSWFAMHFGRHFLKKKEPKWILFLYVKGLNASQPHPNTVTCHRNDYYPR